MYLKKTMSFVVSKSNNYVLKIRVIAVLLPEVIIKYLAYLSWKGSSSI